MRRSFTPPVALIARPRPPGLSAISLESLNIFQATISAISIIYGNCIGAQVSNFRYLISLWQMKGQYRISTPGRSNMRASVDVKD
jgi:hypothetical protein